MAIKDELTSKGFLTYLGLYGVWGIGVNILDIKTNWFRKQEGGGWSKSYKPHFYWDNWSYTHLAWGFAAPFFGISRPIFLVLNALNEIVLERLLCELANSGVTGVRFSYKCDPFSHMLADFMYEWIGYEGGRIMASGRSVKL